LWNLFAVWEYFVAVNHDNERKFDMTAPPSNKILLTRGDLPRLGLNLSPSTLLRLEAAGQFPKRVRIGAHSVAWLAEEIHEHIAKLAAEREEA
tara:strand:+ start:2634 stop:2912 length:279 start_codon:yes stop_codon:yes gene_type:complete